MRSTPSLWTTTLYPGTVPRVGTDPTKCDPKEHTLFYAGDEYADDAATSGPWSEELDTDFDDERQAIEDEYDREQSR